MASKSATGGSGYPSQAKGSVPSSDINSVNQRKTDHGRDQGHR